MPLEGQQRGAPAREVALGLGDEREEVIHGELAVGEREAEVDLGETPHGAPQNLHHCLKIGLRNMDGRDGALVEVDDESRCGRKVIEDAFEAPHRVQLRPDDDDSIIRVLEDERRGVIDERVTHPSPLIIC